MKYAGLKSIAVNASYLYSSFGLTGLVRGIYAVILARQLGPEIYGLFNYGLSWYLAFLPVTLLGLNAFLAREIGSRRPGYETTVDRTLALRSIASLSVAVSCGLIGLLVETEPLMQQLMVIFSVALAGRGMALWTGSVFVAFEKSHYSFQQDALFRTAEVLIGVTILLGGGGVLALALVHASAWWLQGIRGIVLVRRHLLKVRADWNFLELKQLIILAIPFLILNFSSTWLLQGPLVLYRHLAESGQGLGQLALAMQALFLLGGIPWALSQAVLPVLSRAVGREDGKDTLFVEGMLRIGLLSGAMAGLGGMALGPWLVSMLFGADFAQAGKLLGPAFWLMVPMIWTSALSQVVIARGQQRNAAICALIAAVVFVLLCPLLIGLFGTFGALWSAGLGHLTLAIAYIVLVNARTRIDLDRTILRSLFSVALAVASYFALLPVHEVTALIVSLAAMLASAYCCGVVSGAEKNAILRLIRGTR